MPQEATPLIPPLDPSPDEPGESQTIESFVRREMLLGLISPILLLAAIGVAGIFFRGEVTALTTWTYDKLGFTGLATVFFISETIVSPLPPDLVLLIVAGSELRNSWMIPVTLLAFLSTLGGHLGWLLGGALAGTGLVRRMLGAHHGRSVRLTRRYGVWAVVLAALTPIPWSVASWTAGALHLPWRQYMLGSLARFPRIVVYYIFIHIAYHGRTTPFE